MRGNIEQTLKDNGVSISNYKIGFGVGYLLRKNDKEIIFDVDVLDHYWMIGTGEMREVSEQDSTRVEMEEILRESTNDEKTFQDEQIIKEILAVLN
jgi:hypothetical protein